MSYLGRIDSASRDRLLREAAVVVIPSTCAENSPLVYFEALAAGLPVIGSDIGGISELARFGNVLLVEPGDAAALAGALTSLIGDNELVAKLRAAARSHRGDASPERFVGQIESAIAALGAGSGTQHGAH